MRVVIGLLGLMALLVTTGCVLNLPDVSEPGFQCQANNDCIGGYACVDGTCLAVESEEAPDEADSSDPTDPSDATDTADVSDASDPDEPGCGNGVREASEFCDDGGVTDGIGDFCTDDCYELVDFTTAYPDMFLMGSSTSSPGHLSGEQLHPVVQLRKFQVMQYEVTRAQWAAQGLYDRSVNQGSPDLPVTNISWFEAMYYANSLSSAHQFVPCYTFVGCSGEYDELNQCSGVQYQRANGSPADHPAECEGYRLPTEAEWELAARAGSPGLFHVYAISDEEVEVDDAMSLSDCTVSTSGLSDIANYCGSNTQPTVESVGSRRSNPWDLYDVSGNVREWVGELYMGYDANAIYEPFMGTMFEGINSEEVEVSVRGGSFVSNAGVCRLANRDFANPHHLDAETGFRLVKPVKFRGAESTGFINHNFEPDTGMMNIDASFADDDGVAGIYLKFIWEGEDLTLAICEDECCESPAAEGCAVEAPESISNLVYPAADSNSFSLRFDANEIRGKTLYTSLWTLDYSDNAQLLGELHSEEIPP